MTENMPILLSSWTDLAVLAGFGLMFVAFYQRTLIPLRMVAIAGHVVFILHAIAISSDVLIALHGALLALNVIRTAQQISSYRRVRSNAHGPAEADALIPFMRHYPVSTGKMLFRKGDTATEIFYISKGTVQIPEIGKSLVPGELFGEVGLFAEDGKRTASAICAEDCELLVISQEDILDQCMKDPAFGIYLAKLIASRMAENQDRTDTKVSG